jgi:hypothetical protein
MLVENVLPFLEAHVAQYIRSEGGGFFPHGRILSFFRPRTIPIPTQTADVTIIRFSQSFIESTRAYVVIPGGPVHHRK